MLGKYIDSLSDEQRDRIIEAKDFGDGWQFIDRDNPACKCLVGHAEGYYLNEDGYQQQKDETDGWETVYMLFPELMQRFGADRIIRACKLRAAKTNRCDLSRLEVEGIAREPKAIEVS